MSLAWGTPKDWLSNLKVGDEIAVWQYRYPEIRTIERLTPTQLVLDGGTLKFNRTTGNRVSSDKWISLTIGPVTDDVKETVDRAKAIRQLRSIDWSLLPTPLLLQMSNLYKAAVLTAAKDTTKSE